MVQKASWITVCCIMSVEHDTPHLSVKWVNVRLDHHHFKEPFQTYGALQQLYLVHIRQKWKVQCEKDEELQDAVALWGLHAGTKVTEQFRRGESDQGHGPSPRGTVILCYQYQKSVTVVEGFQSWPGWEGLINTAIPGSLVFYTAGGR